MVIYLDILIFVNITVDAVLLWITSRILRLNPKPFRILSALFVSVAYGTLVCLPTFSFGLNIFIRIFFAFSISYIAFGYPSLIGLLKNTGIFTAVTCAYTAILILCQQIPQFSDSIYINNGMVYYNIPIPCILIAILILCTAQMIISKILNRRPEKNKINDCKIIFYSKSIEFKGLTDTGNFLTDNITGRPVVIVDRNVLKKITEIDDTGNFKYDSCSPMHTRVRLIPYKSADGSIGMMNAFRPDHFICNGREYKVLIASNSDVLDPDGVYKGILPVLK